jgi:hypothetical protein
LHTQAYDVIDLLCAGTNAIEVVLSDGWYRGQVGAFRQFNQYGDPVAFLAQLELGFDDGSRQIVATGDDWTGRTGAVLAADLMQGVNVDFSWRTKNPRFHHLCLRLLFASPITISLACTPRLHSRSGASMRSRPPMSPLSMPIARS